ncbi:MAG: diacylglycerol kinase [Alteromonadaceae bacterium]|nr:MAG: diacylglycerol kinase [Alteromonadaceae bacterium]
MQGISAAYRNEAAFRQEIIAAIVLLPLAFWLSVTQVERILLIATVLLVLIVELLNSAVEATVDRIGDEIHELAGRAKDMGSAAVLIAVLLWAYTWVSIVFF